ncbi:MAG: glycerophosphodiester phosphodiesterase [Chloroflexi bacterium]|nr:glycerophosphodiester phosphodiesterase [Chloroflexota bacterium]
MRPARPIAFAHRGASGYARDNTLEAFALALRQGATGIESDAWLSGDGVTVLVHDRTIRPPGRRIDVTRTTAADLARWGVPTLAELYASCGTGFELSLDLEHREVALPVLRAAEAAEAAGRLWVCHDDLDLLAELRAASGAVRLVCSTRPRRIPEGVVGRIDRLAQLGINALNMHWRDWSVDWVECCHTNGIAAFGWDAQEPSTMAQLLAFGIDAIYSDYPDLLVAAIG